MLDELSSLYSLLIPAPSLDLLPGQVVEPPSPVEVQQPDGTVEKEWEVEEILDTRRLAKDEVARWSDRHGGSTR